MNNPQRNEKSAELGQTASIHVNTTLIYILPIIYILFVSIYMIWHRAWFSPDQFFTFALVGTIVIGKVRQFLTDWVPVVLLLFGYEYLRGVIPILSMKPHIFPMIHADTLLFGSLPTISLQTKLFSQGITHWYDYISVILYISHFIIPMFVAFIFWLTDRRLFKSFTSAFLLLSYLAFITYIIFPAMPPWMASSQGYIPPLKKIMDQVLASFAHPISVPSIYQFFGADLVAAVPSLHAAYPWLILLFVVKKIGKAGLIILPYVFGVWFAVVYLGEHYAVDVIVGIIYATVAYLVISAVEKRHIKFALKGGDTK
jgi:hypothetical protein